MSMKALSFVGKTAVITGAGGSIGRCYALELAKRGCNIVVNDPGGSLTGVNSGASNSNDDPVSRVVNEIIQNGGKAKANRCSVLDGGDIVDFAVKEFGSCDIIVNNAGILRDKSFIKMTSEDWQAVLDVHLNGTFSLCHAAWPIMQERSFGRIINIGSGAGLYGNFGQANYSAAKMGILGLTSTLAKEGFKYNINVNCIVPIAESRMTATVLPPDTLKLLNPTHIAPIVTYLAHESSKETGECFEVGGGWYSKVRMQRSAGIYLGNIQNKSSGDSSTDAASAETIASNMSRISDFSPESARCAPSHPTNAADALQELMSALDDAASGNNDKKSSTPGSPSSPSLNQMLKDNDYRSGGNNESVSSAANISFKSDKIFAGFQSLINEDKNRSLEMASKVRVLVQFDISQDDSDSPSNHKKHWLLDTRPEGDGSTTRLPSLTLLTHKDEPASVIEISNNSKDMKEDQKAKKRNLKTHIQCSDTTLLKLMSGDLSPEFAYMRRLLKIDGSMGVALKIKPFLEVLSSINNKVA